MADIRNNYRNSVVNRRRLEDNTEMDLTKMGFENVSYNEGVSKSFRTGNLERELQMVQLPAIRCSCIAIL
jgi:hypothetical protein